MPDIHWGYGFPIGGVAAFDIDEGIVSPGGVGYDINCGVRLLRTGLREDEVKPRIRKLVDRLFTEIPTGVGSRRKMAKVSGGQLRSLLQQGAGWVVKQGWGRASDLERLESGGCLPDADPDSASAQTINDCVSAFGLESLTAGKKAFVNVARRVLIEALYSVLPKHRVVLELLETVKPDAEVMEACRELKRSGYVLALDDYVDDPDYEPLVELADFLKVDFLTTGPDERRKAAPRPRDEGGG